MAIFGIIIGLIGAAVGIVVGALGALVGIVLGFLGGALGLLPVLAPILLIIFGIVWLVKGSTASNVAGVRPEGGGPVPAHDPRHPG